MSAKWIRARKWDDEHLTGVLTPIRWLLGALSSVWLAVMLLILVALYGVVASVPVGLLGKIPVSLMVGLIALTVFGLGAIVPTWGLTCLLRKTGTGKGGRFVVWVVGVVGLGCVAALGWKMWIWSMLAEYWEQAAWLEGYRLWCSRFSAVQFRRLPGVEMSELEFYAWWPLKVILGLFVVNLIVATLRRIEFSFARLGVLMVHTGIVLIAIGSVVYASLKQEGDMLLLAGQLDAEGKPTIGPPATVFYDNNDPALWVGTANGSHWEEIPIPTGIGGLPRYNDYNLGAALGLDPQQTKQLGLAGSEQDHRDCGPLNVLLKSAHTSAGKHDADAAGVHFRIVGYASYCELQQIFVPAPDSIDNPMREIEVRVKKPLEPNQSGEDSQPNAIFRLFPRDAANNSESVGDVLSLHYSIGMNDEQWSRLQQLKLSNDADEQISGISVYLDEQAAENADTQQSALVRAIVRIPASMMGGSQTGDADVTVRQNLKPGEEFEIVPMMSLRLGRRWPSARRLEVPIVVPKADRRANMIGNHESAAIAVQVEEKIAGQARRSEIVWIPFAHHREIEPGKVRRVGPFQVMFGRARHELPMSLRLADFEMIPYPSSDVPRDYRSHLLVMMRDRSNVEHEISDDSAQTRSTSLNEPLLVRVPFASDRGYSAAANTLAKGLSRIFPTQYKFSQTGWDSEGWRQTKAFADAGQLSRPAARFTILGVGNNPGIYVIAFGGVLIGIGIPWAFYLKPIIMRRHKRLLQKQLAAEGKLPSHLLKELGMEMTQMGIVQAHDHLNGSVTDQAVTAETHKPQAS